MYHHHMLMLCVSFHLCYSRFCFRFYVSMSRFFIYYRILFVFDVSCVTFDRYIDVLVCVFVCALFLVGDHEHAPVHSTIHNTSWRYDGSPPSLGE